MSKKTRIEKLEGMMKKRPDPKAAARQAEVVAEVEALMRAPWTPSPLDPEEWKPENIKGNPVSEMLAGAFGVPVWRDGDWHWPEYGSSDYQPWSGGRLNPIPNCMPQV